MLPKEWIRPTETELTAEQVKKLEIGSRVTIQGKDRYGECYRTDCTVTQSGKKKILVSRSQASWEKVIHPIKDAENKRYLIEKKG